MRKVYSECFVFCGVFHKNIHEIPAKCEIRKVYSRPKAMSISVQEQGMWDWSEPEQMPKSGLFGVCLVKKIPSIANVFFFWSTDYKQIVFGCSLNVCRTNKCCSLNLGYMSISTFLSFPHASFGISVRMWTQLYMPVCCTACQTHRQKWPTASKSISICFCRLIVYLLCSWSRRNL